MANHIETFNKVQVVIWGSATHQPHIIERLVAELPFPQKVEPVRAAYDGDVLRIRMRRPYDFHGCARLTPCYGVFDSRDDAEAYADHLAAIVNAKTRRNIGILRDASHIGRRTYNSMRRGLWSEHVPTFEQACA